MIIEGKRPKPITILLHGIAGVGKTTFGAYSNNPIFITAEELDEYNVARFPKCTSFDDFEKQLTYLCQNIDSISYKTLVIDTIDSFENLLHKKIAGNQPMSAAMGGFGKAYEWAAQEMARIRDTYLTFLRKKMNIIILAHSQASKFEDCSSLMTYDVFTLKLHKKATPIFSEWVSNIFFYNYVIERIEEKFAHSSGERKLFTSARPNYLAKNRFRLPDEIVIKDEKQGFNIISKYIKRYYEV